MGRFTLLFYASTLFFFCCSNSDTPIGDENQQIGDTVVESNGTGVVSVTEVAIQGNENNYSFNVTLSSNDTGCQQYADWWEVVDLEGHLRYRRVLAHSHVNEQPFTRSGAPIAITANTEVYVRAHMNNSGYGTKAMKGTVADGFEPFNLSKDFAADLETVQPLPENCTF
ncbi:MAG: hypothetical protein AAGH81_01220 [Bacteroidota bacterium]